MLESKNCEVIITMWDVKEKPVFKFSCVIGIVRIDQF